MTHLTHRELLHLLFEGACETLMPTRCVLCDAPQTLLCDDCLLRLSYIDSLHACPVCGAPWGINLCTECNSFALHNRGLEEFALDGVACALYGTHSSLQLIRVYKDQGEQRLHYPLAQLLAHIIKPTWMPHATIVAIPSRKSARRSRGFDHTALLATECAQLCNLEYCEVLATYNTGDQRALSAAERMKNLEHAFYLRDDVCIPKRIILIDDVFTTGATLTSAAQTLRSAGAQRIYAATIVRM